MKPVVGKFEIEWVDRGHEPECPPDPRYPKGIDLDGSNGAAKTCSVKLPYPAKRCGIFMLRCLTCGYTVAITTAGRPDDPRSVKIACKRKGH